MFKKNKTKKNLFNDSLGRIYFIKRIVIFITGFYTYIRYNGFNKLMISGTENLIGLPKTNVMFVSNHQTYLADLIAMYHVFTSFKNGFKNTIKNPIYLLNPMLDFYYVAAAETVKEGVLQKIIAYVGAVTVERSWRADGVDVERMVDFGGIESIKHALNNGWLINFPQGTTKPFAPCRKGVVHIIKDLKPIVVPIVIDGFVQSFDKRGVFIIKKETKQKLTIKSALAIDYQNESIEDVIEKVMDSIEQSEKFIQVLGIKTLQSNNQK